MEPSFYDGKKEQLEWGEGAAREKAVQPKVPLQIQGVSERTWKLLDAARKDVAIPVSRRPFVGVAADDLIAVMLHEAVPALGNVGGLKAGDAVLEPVDFTAAVLQQGEDTQGRAEVVAEQDRAGPLLRAVAPASGEGDVPNAKQLADELLAGLRQIREDAYESPHDSPVRKITPYGRRSSQLLIVFIRYLLQVWKERSDRRSVPLQSEARKR